MHYAAFRRTEMSCRGMHCMVALKAAMVCQKHGAIKGAVVVFSIVF